MLERSGIHCEPRLFVDPVLCVAAPWPGCRQHHEVPMPFVVKRPGYIISPYFDYLSFLFDRRWRSGWLAWRGRPGKSAATWPRNCELTGKLRSAIQGHGVTCPQFLYHFLGCKCQLLEGRGKTRLGRGRPISQGTARLGPY